MTATAEHLDTSVLEALFTDPDLHADHLPGETDTDRAARRIAAADITDHTLAAIANARPGEAAPLIRERVEAHAAEAAALVASWSEQIRGAVA